MKIIGFMKKYITPATVEQTVQQSGILCASEPAAAAQRVSSNINVSSEGKSGDVTNAF